MPPVAIYALAGVVAGLLIAWVLGMEGGQDAFLALLAFAVGVFLVKSGAF